MSLGQNIYSLRTAREMSQLELAEALGVSRQSISKWETDASTQELEKLIRLSQLFGVSLDELVSSETPSAGRDAPSAPPDEHEIKYVYAPSQRFALKIVAAILLSLGFLCVLFLGILGELLGGCIIALPFVISTYLWKYSELTVQMIIATALLAILVALMLATAYHLRSPHIDLRANWKKPLIIVLMLLALRLVIYFGSTKLNVFLLSQNMQFANALLVTLTISLRTAILTALFTLASRCTKWKK